MSNLITTAYPATLPESGYERARKEHRVWYVVYRPSEDRIGITPELMTRDEIILTCEPEMLSSN